MTEHIRATTFHRRRGKEKNTFSYGVDYILTDLNNSADRALPWPISHNRFNLWSLNDRRHGGPRERGSGMAWFAGELEKRNFPFAKSGDGGHGRVRLVLLAQPAFLWFHFSPVSFWLALVDGKLCAFIAEVNSTFGQRHCYFCAHDDFSQIKPDDRLTAEKLMHISPFQTVEGQYHFNFDFSETDINIRILYDKGDDGVVATLRGKRQAATSGSLLGAAMRRPFGAGRVLALIHWQAAKLYFKGAKFLGRQREPETLISDSQNLKARNK